MARADIKIVDTGGHGAVPTFNWQVDDTATSSANAILAGEPVKQGAAASQYAIPLADGDLTIGTDQPMIGIAKNDSTATSSANGVVDVYMPLPGVLYEMRAKTASLVDTQAEIDAIVGENLVMDLTSSSYTLDTAGGSAASNAFLVVGGNVERRSLQFHIGLHATVLGRGSA